MHTSLCVYRVSTTCHIVVLCFTPNYEVIQIYNFTTKKKYWLHSKLNIVFASRGLTHGLINDLGISQEHIRVLCDSQSAICLAKNSVHHARTKHIDVRFHFVREILNEGDILLEKINIANNPADMMTKVVSGIKFQHYLDLINISP